MDKAETIQQPKYPCRSCIYFRQCGSTTRTEQCKGRKVKMNVCRVRKNGVGEVSSKYGFDRDGSQFEADIKAHQERGEALYAAFVELMKNQEVTPEAFRKLFHLYYEEFLR